MGNNQSMAGMNTNQSMIGFIKDTVRNADEDKIIFNNRIYSIGQVFSAAASVATFLKRNGVTQGDSVIVCLPNVPQAAIALYAINSIGAVANVAHPRIGAEALTRMAKESDTEWLFVFGGRSRARRKALKRNGLKCIVCRADDESAGSDAFRRATRKYAGSGAIDYGKTLIEPTEFNVEIRGDAPAVYLHSSGTTGRSKTVVLSNRAMNELAAGIAERVRPKRGNTMLMTLPMFHGFGLGVCVHLMMCVGRIAMLPAFRPKQTAKMLENYSINYMAVVPNMLRRLIAEPKFFGKKLQSLEYIFVGGDRLDENLKKRASDTLRASGSECKVCEGFGLSEFAGVTHINLDCEPGGTVGRPLDGVRVRIVRDGAEAKPGEDGVIFMTARSMMDGYLEGDAEFVVDESGTRWFDTGDIGSVRDGLLYYKGREKRLLKIGGVNIYPQEVEAAAESLGEVKAACAVRTEWKGKPAIRLLVSLNGRRELTLALKSKICRVIASKIMPYAAPKYIERVRELRANETGKVDYRHYEERRGRAGTEE